MLRRLRSSSPARLALYLASFLAVAGAFGLHPEQPLRASGALDGPEVSRFAAQPAPHACPACLAHGAGLVQPFGGFVLAPAASEPAALPETPVLCDRLAGRNLSGRSPPHLS